MNASGESTKTASPSTAIDGRPIRPGARPHDPRRLARWVQITLMTIGFAVVMLVSNSIASTLGNPVAALLVGPLLAVLILWLFRLAARRLERRSATDLGRTRARSQLLWGVAGGFLLATATIGLLALLGGYEITGWGSLSGALTVLGM